MGWISSRKSKEHWHLHDREIYQGNKNCSSQDFLLVSIFELLQETNGDSCPVFPERGESTSQISVLLILSKTPFSIEKGFLSVWACWTFLSILRSLTPPCQISMVPSLSSCKVGVMCKAFRNKITIEWYIYNSKVPEKNKWTHENSDKYTSEKVKWNNKSLNRYLSNNRIFPMSRNYCL